MKGWIARIAWWRSPGYTCADIAIVLQAYIDGEIDEKTATDVANHLEVCGGCEAEAKAFQGVILRLREADARQVDQSRIAALSQFGRSLIEGDGPTVTDH